MTDPGTSIPQGVALDKSNRSGRFARHRSARAPTAGYVAAFLLLPGDRGGDNPLYDVAHLLELWDEVVGAVPDARALARRRAERRRCGAARRPERRLARARCRRSSCSPRVANLGRRALPAQRRPGRARVEDRRVPRRAGSRSSRTTRRSSPTCARPAPGCSSTRRAEFVEAAAGLLANDERRAELAAARARCRAKRGTGGCSRSRYAAILDEHLPRLD